MSQKNLGVMYTVHMVLSSNHEVDTTANPTKAEQPGVVTWMEPEMLQTILDELHHPPHIYPTVKAKTRIMEVTFFNVLLTRNRDSMNI